MSPEMAARVEARRKAEAGKTGVLRESQIIVNNDDPNDNFSQF